MKLRSIALATTAAVSIAGAAQAQEVFELSSTYAQNLPILGTASVAFVEKINGISESVEFEHFNPGELVPALEVLDATSNGSIDAAYSTAGYWQGRFNAAGLFAAVPFGPEPGEMLAWMMYDDGMELFQRMYDEGGYNVKVLVCGMYAPETSGWFKEEITSLDQLQGLNMRFFGLGAEVMEKLGVSTSLLAGGDIFPALERGAIDATEFSMPLVDANLGFYNIAKYNYFPGWHQPSTLFELLINKDRWDDLDERSQRQIEIACMANLADNFAEGEAKNFPAMKQNVEEYGVEIKNWTPEQLDAFEAAWEEVAAELAAEDPFFKEVWDDLQEFREGYALWGDNIYLPRPRD
ncbi:TRAP transporter substrate-binding protein [Jannaschia formosa]|uniref:TRAP transporter substrate-binding protein n=1 Tax=Jannaschia formosa TaxID=2259592 RepID=UPI000E1B5352|nr:TRAP transporter substrate-binding protein [Jannaschia formosa]TFL17904.1 TRAP transporter substrate-binding protein [Jannaschia formosa]